MQQKFMKRALRSFKTVSGTLGSQSRSERVIIDSSHSRGRESIYHALQFLAMY